ncbi:hypothetical protein EJB05_54821 [Eragrostis curvula]|uniref:Uncharacterized protein n=1 Tax=Eragrostis curvula TaxID=38414 RepID=A0A5J9SLA8_9POAL|nr:hypothetical protein EJB05_54821 [Eragrostis curvula]
MPNQSIEAEADGARRAPAISKTREWLPGAALLPRDGEPVICNRAEGNKAKWLRLHIIELIASKVKYFKGSHVPHGLWERPSDHIISEVKMPNGANMPEPSREVTKLRRHWTIEIHAGEVEICQAPEGAQKLWYGYSYSPKMVPAEIEISQMMQSK